MDAYGFPVYGRFCPFLIFLTVCDKVDALLPSLVNVVSSGDDFLYCYYLVTIWCC